MLGAIVGDIVGSRFEFACQPDDGTYCEFTMPPAPGFDFLSSDCFFTDDTVLTVAICQALTETGGNSTGLPQRVIELFCEYARRYPLAGYGARFDEWLHNPYRKPYMSLGNGAGMRVSGCAYAAETLDDALLLADLVTAVTHNHPEGLLGARAVTATTFLARQGKNKEEIRSYVTENFYSLDFTIDQIRNDYWKQRGLGTCGMTIPQALQAFFESTDFESAIRLAVGLGGDTDTLGAIVGAPAGAYYGVPSDVAQKADSFLSEDLREALTAFEVRFPV